jgi:hypothetical protein
MAKKVEFLKEYDHTFRPSHNSIPSEQNFPKGYVGLVPEGVAEAAIAGGYAQEVSESKGRSVKASEDAGRKSA